MSFRIVTHGRLQEWIADANGYFAEEGLTDYVMGQVDLATSTPAKPSGAYQSFEAGFPTEYHDRINVAAFGPGERIVFEPYSAEMYQKTHEWVEERAIFETEKVGRAAYEEAALPVR